MALAIAVTSQVADSNAVECERMTREERVATAAVRDRAEKHVWRATVAVGAVAAVTAVGSAAAMSPATHAALDRFRVQLVGSQDDGDGASTTPPGSAPSGGGSASRSGGS